MEETDEIINEGLEFITCPITEVKTKDLKPPTDEILSPSQLEHFAKILGKKCAMITLKGQRVNLKRELYQKRSTLKEIYLYFAETEATEALATGSEWIIDNHPFLEQQIEGSKNFLSEKLDTFLPILKMGPYQGYPRIYCLADQLIRHTDAKITDNTFLSFVENFQKSEPLLMRELWAFPTMMNLCLARRLAKLATFNQVSRKQQLIAEAFIDELFAKPLKPSELVIQLSNRIEKDKKLCSTGTVVFLLKKLKEQGTKGSLCTEWLTQKVSEMGTKGSSIVEHALHLLSTTQISIANCITCFRILATYNWLKWFENTSSVHQLLKQDPGGVYPISDFKTRERCRHHIQRLANGLFNETEIANQVLKFCQEKKSDSVCDALISNDLEAFEKYVHYRAPFHMTFSRYIKKRVFGVWLLTHCLATLLFTAIPVYYMYTLDVPMLGLISTSIAFLLLGTKIASQFIQWVAFYLINPKPLSKLDKAVLKAPEHCTLITLHTIFRSKNAIKDAVSELEILSFANKEPYIYFALAADFPDANEKVLSEDRENIATAKKLIERLNQKSNRFFLITRERTWNGSEKKFIGWERKRGKIHQINRCILGHRDPTIHIEVGDQKVLKMCRFVITLDEDTKIPPEMARLLIATIAHPLNAPKFVDNTQKLAKGYVIIQPTIQSSLRQSLRSHFSKIFAIAPGMDPYTELISNTYQDLFKEASYVGKAIYDIKAFEKSLDGWIPENQILSHDLLEGLFARVGYASSVLFIDTFPSNYLTFASRLHRWIRGDWQLLPWLFAKIPNANKITIKGPISPIGRWKILDNLLRSLVFPISLILLVLGVSIFPGNPLVWCGIVLVTINFNLILTLLNACLLPVIHPLYALPLTHKAMQNLKKDTTQMLFRTSVIPATAFVSIHAIFVTLYRMFISRKHLLEWTPTAVLEKKSPTTFHGVFSKMWIVWFFTAVLTLFLFALFPKKALLASPLFLLWLLAPVFVYLTAKTPTTKKVRLADEDRKKLHQIAKETWNYFDTLITDKTHYLVPDNVQLTPKRMLANRTSPTNIGFQFLSALSAYDLGLISLKEVLDRLEKTLQTLDQMEKCNGHLYNWYDIVTLQPLHPRYVSSVDSGNFISHCLTVKNALLFSRDAPIISHTFWEYLNAQKPISFAEACDTLKNLKEEDLSPSLFSFFEKLQVFQTLKKLYQLENKLNVSKELRDKLKRWLKYFKRTPIPNWATLHKLCHQLQQLKHIAEKHYVNHPKALAKSKKLHEELKGLFHYTAEVQNSFHRVIEKLTQTIEMTDFRFLFSKKENLLAIGYQVDTSVLDPNFYNLLASEASITSLVAIAKGDIPYKNWFTLGRQLVKCQSGKTLLSWSGSAFEYLMPTILVHPLKGTLMDHSFSVAVKEQIRYGKEHHLPWGISESGYAVVDLEGNYQYRAFGVPSLALKRGIENDYVISPYSTFLALSTDPKAALRNIAYLERENTHGSFGFYEAIDYTPERLSNHEKSYLLKSFLAHHQGMILTSINNVLNQGILQDRFQNSTYIKAVDLLLQEPFPHHGNTIALTRPHMPPLKKQQLIKPRLQQIEKTPHTFFPLTHVLSNGKLSQMIDNSGSGYLFYDKDIALTRWTQDLIQNAYGYYIFIKDVETKKVWSAGYQPTRNKPDFYEVVYYPEKVEFRRQDHGIHLKMEITHSPEHNCEIRKLTFKNDSKERRTLEITSYGEVILRKLAADAQHPTFSNMFVESAFNEKYDALIFKRIARQHDEKEMFMAHMLTSSVCWSRIQWETNRYLFIGRGGSIHHPEAMDKELSLTTGRTLDPIFSLRATVVLQPQSSEELSFIVLAAETLEEINRSLDVYFSPQAVDRGFAMSRAKSQVELRYERISLDKIPLIQAFSLFIFFSVDPYRPGQIARQQNVLTQEGLWKHGISGDDPIILIHMRESQQLTLLEDLLTAHHYLFLKGVKFDLVILNEVIEGYRTEFQERIENSMAKFGTPQNVLLNRSLLTKDEVTLLEAVANMTYGPLDTELLPKISAKVEPFHQRRSVEEKKEHTVELANCLFFNGYGAFIEGGKAYRIFRKCPHPWSNVIGTESFGFLLTETGGGYTWSENCQTQRVSPWRPDVVSDPKSEMLYIRDSATKKIYFPLSVGESICEHHRGFTRFFSTREEFSVEVIVSLSLNKKVKWWKVRLTNHSDEIRSFEMYLVVDWILGTLTDRSKQHLICNFDRGTQILTVFNRYEEFSKRCVFMGSSEDIYSFTTSRREFIGRNGDFLSPAVFQTTNPLASLKNTLSSGSDCLGALHVIKKVFPKEENEILFYLAERENLQAAKEAALSYHSLKTWEIEFDQIQNTWKELTETIQIKTPELSFNILMNSWLLYQTLSARFFAKTGYYQSSGAIGFRDQLQDSMALLWIRSDLTRRQLILHASRQFLEGDVQHWWSPQTGKGVRTRISDDYLWLPYVLLRYLELTEDRSILEEVIPFLEGEALKSDEQEIYMTPKVSSKTATLYNHCTLAIDRALNLLSERGLPLIGCGDWNDGMNAVGIHGKGESVWLGWFLSDILKKFSQIADKERAKKYRDAAGLLLENIEKHGWDGKWYRRAYFDDGAPIGSKNSEECKIDSIAQAWSVLSKSENKERQVQAMDAAISHLVDEKHGLIKLLTPAFEKMAKDPGYIKSYPPGVRENGGQYTHAAAWLILAKLSVGEGDKAFQFFQLINPINHTLDEQGVQKYRGEPYVLAGDVYSESPFAGQAGWTWYTGAAGWLYTVGIESILGLKLRGKTLTVDPCIPKEWETFEIQYLVDKTPFHILVKNPDKVQKGVLKITVNGVVMDNRQIPLPQTEKRETKFVEVIMGNSSSDIP